jgi:hypothetical protein
MEHVTLEHMNWALPSETDFCELVGDLSEGVFSCSFNDDDIFRAAFLGSLDESIKTTCSYERERCMGLIGDYGIAEGEFGARIIELTRKHQGWPDSWAAPLTPIYELDHRYRECLIAPEHRDLLELKQGTTYRLSTYILDFSGGRQVHVTVADHTSESGVIRFRPNGVPGELAIRTNIGIDDHDIVIELTLDPKLMRITERKAQIVRREFKDGKHIEHNTDLVIHNVTIMMSPAP